MYTPPFFSIVVCLPYSVTVCGRELSGFALQPQTSNPPWTMQHRFARVRQQNSSAALRTRHHNTTITYHSTTAFTIVHYGSMILPRTTRTTTCCAVLCIFGIVPHIIMADSDPATVCEYGGYHPLRRTSFETNIKCDVVLHI